MTTRVMMISTIPDVACETPAPLDAGKGSGLRLLPERIAGALDFQDDGHDERAAAGALLDVALEVVADLFLDDAVVGLLFVAGGFERALDDLARLGDHSGVVDGKSAHDDLGEVFHLAGALVDGDDRQDDAALGDVLAVADDHVLNDVDGAAGIDADAADGDLAALGRAVLVKVEDLTVFEEDDFLDDVHVAGKLGVALEVAVVAVDGDEEPRPQQVEHEAHRFLRAVTADVDEAGGAIVVDDLGVAALEVVDHAID